MIFMNQPCTVGWVVFQKKPWRLKGPFADFDDAARTAEALGSQFRIAYGERVPGTDDFVPLEEPLC